MFVPDRKISSLRFLKNTSHDIEPNEIFLDSLAQKKEKEMGLTGQKFETPLMQKTLIAFRVFCFLMIFILFARTFQYQILQGSDFSAKARDNKFIFNQIRAERGVMYDRNLNQLVFNEPSFDLVCNTAKLAKHEEIREKFLKETPDILKISAKELQDIISENPDSGKIIFTGLDHERLIILETKISEFPDCEIVNNPVRKYKDGEVFSHIVGYIARIESGEFEKLSENYSINDYIGRSGIENYYESVLRKKSGQLRIERNAKGEIISKETVSLPESGNSLVLWLDADLQKKLNDAIISQMQILGAKKAVAIAMDPNTGGILALVSFPSFDNNLFQKGADQKKLQDLLLDSSGLDPLFNRAIAGKYPTGSTIKPLMASAALQENLISPEKQIYSPGYIEVSNRYNPEATHIFKDWTVHGWVDMRKALAQSSNVYFYTIGGGYKDQNGLGPSRIKKYLELFGWATPTGIDLPGEAKGFIPDITWKKQTLGENWWDGDTYNLSIGQGFLQVTPLEVVTSIAAVANGGKLMQPEIIQKVVNGSKNSMQVVETMESKVVSEGFINPEYLQIVREGMRQAVTGYNSPLASAVMLNSLPVTSAAKTGTAELGNDHYHNWISVFAPYENPEIVLTVMIEDVKGVHSAAVPVAREVLEWYFTKKSK